MLRRLNRLTTCPSMSLFDGRTRALRRFARFHMLLIPTSAPHNQGHYHRVIEIGKKKMPDADAKYQVIWGLVSSVSTDQGALKTAFGAYSYETKTRGKSTDYSFSTYSLSRSVFSLSRNTMLMSHSQAHDISRQLAQPLAATTSFTPREMSWPMTLTTTGSATSSVFSHTRSLRLRRKTLETSRVSWLWSRKPQ